MGIVEYGMEFELIPMYGDNYFAELSLNYEDLSWSWQIYSARDDKYLTESDSDSYPNSQDAIWAARKYLWCKIIHEGVWQQFLADCGDFVVDCSHVEETEYVNLLIHAQGVKYKMRGSLEDWIISKSEELPDGCKIDGKELILVRPHTYVMKEAILNYRAWVENGYQYGRI